MISMFTSDSQHPPKFRHAVHLGDIDMQPLKTAQNNGVFPFNENMTLGQLAGPDKDAFSGLKRTDTCILILLVSLQRCFLR